MSWCFHRDYLSPNDWLSIYFCYDKKLFCQVLMHSKILATGCLNFWGSTLCQVRTVDGWNWKINNLKKNLKNSKKKKNSKGTWKDPGNRLFALLGGQSCLRCGYLDMSDIPPICWLVCCLMLENGWNLKNRLKLEKWLQHSKVPKHVTLLFFLLLICCSLYLPLSTYFVGVWQAQ